MAKEPPIHPQLRRLDEIGAARSPPLTRTAIARLANVSEGTLRKLELRPQGGMTATTVAKLAAALGVSPGDLMAVDAPLPRASRPNRADSEENDDLPLLGSAAGAAVAAFILATEPIDWLPRPPSLKHVKGAYAVYVENDSMAPMHMRGDLRIIDPNKPARTGDTVIVQTVDENGERQAWIKLLEKQTDGWLVCKQLNPAAEVRYRRDRVVSLHRVLTTAELFNR